MNTAYYRMNIRPKQIDYDALLSKLRDLIPVDMDSVNNIYIVGSFADADRRIDRGCKSDIDIFLNIDDEAQSVSCIEGFYGSLVVETYDGLETDREVQFLTSRQPRVTIESFNSNIKIYGE